MDARTLFKIIAALAMWSAKIATANPQLIDDVARERASNALRSHLHLKAEEFLDVQRNEKLEQLLAVASGRPSRPAFVYLLSRAGDEVKGNTIVHHIFTDIDPTYIFAVDKTDGSAYRIRGFADSLAAARFSNSDNEFDRA